MKRISPIRLGRNDPPALLELKESLQATQDQLGHAYKTFDYVSDPELTESCIFEIRSLRPDELSGPADQGAGGLLRHRRHRPRGGEAEMDVKTILLLGGGGDRPAGGGWGGCFQRPLAAGGQGGAERPAGWGPCAAQRRRAPHGSAPGAEPVQRPGGGGAGGAGAGPSAAGPVDLYIVTAAAGGSDGAPPSCPACTAGGHR